MVPGVPLIDDRAVVVVLHGLLTGLLVPAAGTQFNVGQTVDITAQVRMMCGCKIENHYWPDANFNVQALIAQSGRTTPLTLQYNGTPSEFSGQYKFTSPGPYTIGILATQTDGNLGSTPGKLVIVR